VKRPKNISELIGNSKNLPSLPQILLRLIDACNDESVPLETLSKIISKDPSLCAKVMRLINSPFVGLGNKIKTIDQAVIYLGTDTIKNIAISASVFQAFKRPEYRTLFELNQFWFHSFTCAIVARKIANKISYGSPEEAFLAGLLHDIGKLILVVNFPKEFSCAVGSPITPVTYPMDAENSIGISHSEAGAYMIRSWKLKTMMADAVLYHHETLRKIEDAFPLVKIIYTANILFHAGENKYSREGFKPAEALFGFSSIESEEIVMGARQEAIDVAASFEIDITPYTEIPEGNWLEEPIKVRENAHNQLVSEVTEITMMHGTLQNLLVADSMASILKVVEKGLSILFEVQDVCFFVFEPEKNILVGAGAEGDERREPIIGLAIKPDSQNCIARCFRKRTFEDTFDTEGDEELSILDEQLVRLIDCEGILCVPMMARRSPAGVIVMGVSADRKERLLKQSKRLSMFVNQAAVCLRMEKEKETNIRIVKTERLDASSATARKVIHEVNNPLGIIKNYIKILGLKLPEKHPAQDELKIISEEIDRVKLIMMNLSAFSRPAGGLKELVDVNATLAGFLTILEKSVMIPAGIELQFAPDDNLPKVYSVKNNIKQAVLNFVKNSAEAMKEGGIIYISTRSLNAAGKALSSELTEDVDSIEIRIRDNGPGLPENIKAHIFEPFYSTKEGEHSGLGLAIANSSITEIGGTITWVSDKDNGTRFSIILPISAR